MRISVGTGKAVDGSVAGVLAVAAVTYGAFALRVNAPSAGFLYLLLIVLVALRAGFAAATVVSLAAVVCLDYYFIPPVFSVNVTDPQNWLALMTFECTALIVSRLSSRANEQARIAEKQHADRNKLYQLSRGVLLSDPARPVSPQILALVRQMLHVEAAAIFDGGEITRHGIGEDAERLEMLARDSYLMDRDYNHPANGEWARVLRLGGKPTGSIAMRAGGLNADLADAVASLTSIAVERSRGSIGRPGGSIAARRAIAFSGIGFARACL